ncbi:MAG: hypothetical protein ACK4K7_13840 [Allosphingosinicella sp.]|uniref:hypothetical protein n=1 Tax=Allosphingosinicella sp. TaxID=2823234 RepID=UPI00392E88E2
MKGDLKLAVAGGGALLLAGCVPQVATTPGPGGAVTPARPTYSMAGLEAVMGRNAAALTRQFGDPDLDVREGNARKLQFGSAVCVLDAYLYPPAGGGEAIVTYVDARLPDGRDVDRASCVAALGRR